MKTMGLMQKSKPFKFFRVVMPLVRKLEARANHYFTECGQNFSGPVNLWKCVPQL